MSPAGGALNSIVRRQPTVLREFLSTFALPIGLALGLLWSWARWNRLRHVVTPIETSDPLWLQAIESAQGSLPLLRHLYSVHGSEIYVKYPLVTASGQIEHVWGRLLALGDELLQASLETPTVNRLSSFAPFSIGISSLEDWQLVLPDGEVRGGFTTQAQIILARRSQREIPPTIAAMEGRFSDVLRSVA